LGRNGIRIHGHVIRALTQFPISRDAAIGHFAIRLLPVVVTNVMSLVNVSDRQ
jgi:hypothetical protein